MPFVPVPDTIQVEVVYEYNGQISENTMYFKSDTPWDESTILDQLIVVKDAVVEVLLPLLSNTIKLVRLVGTLLEAVDSLGVVMAVSPSVSGSVVSAPLPNNSSYVVTFNTLTRGRSGRGRNYIPGLTTVVQADANSVTDGFRTGLFDYFVQIKANSSEIGNTMVVVSRFSGVDAEGKPIPRTVGVTHPIISFTTFDKTLDSQRRRLPGRGA